MSCSHSNRKSDSKIHNEGFNSLKLTHRIFKKLSPLSDKKLSIYRNNLSQIISAKIFNIDRSSLRNGNNEENLKIDENLRFIYPYKPNIINKSESNKIVKKPISSRKINSVKMNSLYLSNNSRMDPSFENNISSIKSTFQNSQTNDLHQNPLNKKTILKLMPKRIKVNSNDQRKKLKLKYNILCCNIKNYNYDDKIIYDLKDDNNINGKFFLVIFDNINSDKNYIIRYKEKLGKYFKEKNKFNINFSYLKELLNNFVYDENTNYLTDIYSTKKVNFSIKNSIEIKMEISSVKLIFYEISNINKNNIVNKEQKNNDKNLKYIFNSKIKLPFEFLAIFYGLKFEDFINLLLSLIDYDFSKNIFYISNNNFINKIEESKALYDFYTNKCYALNNELNKAKE